MNKVRIQTNKGWLAHKVQLPKSWDEMSSDSLVFVCKVLTRHKLEVARGIILRHFLNIKERRFQQLNDGQLVDLLQCIDWISLKGLRSQIFRAFKRNWSLPSTDFKDGLCYEYAKADEYFGKFKESGMKDDLDMFFACLTRFKNRALIDDILLAKSKNKSTTVDAIIQKRMKQTKRIPLYVKAVTLAYFSGIKEYVHQLYGQWLFTAPLDSTPQPSINFGWWGVFLSVSESNTFGDIDNVHRSNFHDVCAYLVQKKEEYLLSQPKAS